jgi:uncharacterized protein (DUF433 family)
MIDWSSCPDVERDADRVSGAWVFRGTRVPVAALFENVEDGATVQNFLECSPASPHSKPVACWNMRPSLWKSRECEYCSTRGRRLRFVAISRHIKLALPSS